VEIKKEDIILAFVTPKEFANWFKNNYDTATSIWLRIYKKSSGKISINYDQALEEALCYGWIDGISKKYDGQSYLQRFTPRRPKSNWSKRNMQLIQRLIQEGRMQKAGLEEVEKAKKDGRWPS